MKNKKLAVLSVLPIVALMTACNTGASAKAAEARAFIEKSSAIDADKIIKNSRVEVNLNNLSAKGNVNIDNNSYEVNLSAASQKVVDMTLPNFVGVLANLNSESLLKAFSGDTGEGMLSNLAPAAISLFFGKWFDTSMFDLVASAVNIVNTVSAGAINESYALNGEDSLSVKYTVTDLGKFSDAFVKLSEQGVLSSEIFFTFGKSGQASFEYTYGKNGYLQSLNASFDSDEIAFYKDDTIDPVFAGSLHGGISINSTITFYESKEFPTITFGQAVYDEDGKAVTAEKALYTVRALNLKEIQVLAEGWMDPGSPLYLRDAEKLEALGEGYFNRILPGLGSFFTVEINTDTLKTEKVEPSGDFQVIGKDGRIREFDMSSGEQGRAIAEYSSEDGKTDYFLYWIPETAVKHFLKGDFTFNIVFDKVK